MTTAHQKVLMSSKRQHIIFMILAFTALTGSGCASLHRPGDHWFGRDKFYHFTASAIIAAGSTAAIDKNSSQTSPEITAFALTGVVGAGKEAYDAEIKDTFWSWKDMAWDFIGASAGCCIAVNIR